MRFDRIRLRNFKPYEDADLRLNDGVTVVHGINGSGKSSLLDACFFALYGANALDETLDDVVTTGEDEAEIDLWFTHDGDSYHVERRLRRSGDRVQTATCVLHGPDEEAVDGARDVRRRVTSLLRMDDEAFVNCAYVRQGEVNKLINATPAQRQDVIDDLLQLGKLEEYRERAAEARLGVNDVLADARGRLSEVDSQIEAKADADLHATLNSLRSSLNDVDDEIERLEGQAETAEATREEAESVLDSYEETRERLSSLEDDVESLQESIRETERERESHASRIRELEATADDHEDALESAVAGTDADGTDEAAIEARMAALDDREDDLREDLNDARMRAQAFDNQASNLAERASELDDRADEARDRAADLEAEAEDLETRLEERRDRLSELDDRIDDLRARFDDAPCAFGEADAHLESVREELESLRERQQSVSADLHAAKRRVEEAEELLAAGKCPECGQSVEGAPHVETIDEDRTRVSELRETLSDLADRRETVEETLECAEALADAEADVARLRERRTDLQDLVDDRRATLEETREKATNLRGEAADRDAEADEKRDVAEEKRTEAAEARETVADLESALDAVTAERDRLETAAEHRSAIADANDEIDRLRDKRESLADLNDERRDRLAEKRETRDELRDGVDEDRIEEARDDKQRAETYLEQVREELDSLRDRRDDLQSRIGGVEADIAQLEKLREQRDAVRDRVDALETLHEETTRLESMYGDLRADLRQRNVETLERMVNETFELVYGNDAYSHIRLDGEYDLTVFQKDGTALDPEQLSGGERALFNLSLRCGIYRLLAEGIDGAAPMPPLILDEPTVFLDSGHVSRLVALVGEMRDLGVNQIIIVSHDEELVGAADEVVTVEKDPTSNRSSVHRETTVPLGRPGDD